MKIPDLVRVNGVDYTIIKDVKTLNDGMVMLHGLVDFDHSLIKLNGESGDHQRQCITLWHELCHIFLNLSGPELSKEDEELICDSVARGVYAVLQDNARDLYDSNY